jgi:lipoprotein-anchoring transpeptidase ErfK/SrfK
MKLILRPLLVLLVLATMLSPISPASAASPGFVVVNWGDTLYSIAARSGTSVDALVRSNNLPNANFIWAGQRLMIPGASYAPAPAPASVSNRAPAVSVYVVSRGDTLATIAARYGTTVDAMARANGLYNPNFVWVGQRLNVPGSAGLPAPQPGPAPVNPPNPGNTAPAPTGGKWIDINISTQTITAFQGNTPLKSVLVSTGVSWHPTPIGRYAIYTKVASQTMSGGAGGEYYYLPGVPWVMYFAGANAIHGTYWHRNFGHPMSHGCVNLTIDDAHWFYDWAEIGTPVITHL